MNAGVFFAFLVGAFFHFTVVPYLGQAFTVLFMVSLFFIPESPQYLAQTNQLEKLEKSSVFYHGGMAVNTEDNMEKQVDTKSKADSAMLSEPQSDDNKITFDDLRELIEYSNS